MAIIDENDFYINSTSMSDKQSECMTEFFQLCYIFSGHKKYFINHSLHEFSNGETILINKGDISNDRSEHSVKTEYCVITLSSRFLKELSRTFASSGLYNIFEMNKIIIPRSCRSYFEKLLRLIQNEYTETPDIYSLNLLKLHISEILILLSRYYTDANLSDVSKNPQEQRICDVCRHICNYYNEPLPLGEMAKLASMSPTYFSKKFKKVTGFGFNEYVNRVRVKIASDMLIQTNHSITDIASYCGYQDANYFGDVFRRIIGMSPSKYRKTHPKTS